MITKEAGEEVGLMAVGGVEVEGVDIPGHVHEGLDAEFHGFDVAHVEQPVTVCPVVVGLLQFLVHQHRRRCVEPQIVMRSPKITQVVIDACPTLALLLFGIRHTLHIAVVVIDPDDGDIIGHLKAVLIDIHGLLIGHEDLRDLRRLPADMFL